MTTLNSDTFTNGIRVQVFPKYIAEKSCPEHNIYFFSYNVKISNEGNEPAQLISRHWIIINADGETEEIKDFGVIGEMPYLHPGESFEYTSFCPLNTNWGTMEGSYQMQKENGDVFDAHIGRFYLCDVQFVE